MGANGLPRTLALLEQGIDRGDQIAAQLYVPVAGVPIADVAIGAARSGRALRSDDLFLWLSACKPAMAIAIGQLDGARRRRRHRARRAVRFTSLKSSA